MPTLWRQTGTLHPAFERFHRCLADDWFLLPYELKLQAAHAKTLSAAEVLEPGELVLLLSALESLEAEWVGRPTPDVDDEDLHTWVENRLTEKVGTPGRKIHTARSRNDQVATLLELFRRSTAGARAARAGLTASRHRRSPSGRSTGADLQFPLQTHCPVRRTGQSWEAGRCVTPTAFERGSASRLALSLQSLWRASAALSDQGAVAGLVHARSTATIQAIAAGVRRARRRTRSTATSRRDETRAVELLALAAHLATAPPVVGRPTRSAFAQTPFSWLLPVCRAASMTGSSMMPNKSNPDAAELLRGESNGLHGALVHALTLLKGLPSGYNRDLQALKPVIRDAMERAVDLVALALALVEAMRFDAERLAESMGQGNIGATLRMERRVLDGVPLREAHHAEAAATGSDAPESSQRYVTLGAGSPVEVRRAAEALIREHGSSSEG